MDKTLLFVQPNGGVPMAQHIPGYQPDTISLPEGRAYLIRLNADRPDESVSLHYHDHYEAMLALSGNMVCTVAGRQYPLQAGSLLLIEPNRLHQLHSRTGGHCERIGLRFGIELPLRLSAQGTDLAACLLPAPSAPARAWPLEGEPFRQMQTLLRALLAENACGAFGRQLAEQTLLTQFFLCVNRAAQQGRPQAPQAGSSARLVQQVVDYIEQNHDRPLTLEQLSRRFYVDRFRLSREFSRLVGCPPHRYLLQKRLQHAEQLLRTGVPPQQAAAQCGFSDYANFYRRFRTAYGAAPRSWQQQARGAAGTQPPGGG